MNAFSFLDPSIAECKFASEPVVIWVNKFDEESSKEFATKMSQAQLTGQPVVPIVIDSYGGNGHSLLSMIADIENSFIPVSTIVKGKAMSAAAVLMTCGAKGMRYIDRNASVMVHEAASGSDWKKASELESFSDEIKKINIQIYEIMSTHCGKGPNFFLKEMKKRGNADWYLTPEEVVKIKMADYIGLPQLRRDVTVNWSYGHGE